MYYLKLFDETLITFEMERKLSLKIFNINVVSENKRLFPEILQSHINSENIEEFLKQRIVPKNRAFVDEILRAQDLTLKDIKGVIDICKGLSLNDCYWVTDNETMKFEDYNLYDNNFSTTLSLIAFTGYTSKIKGIAMSQAQKDIMKKEMDLKNDLPVILIFGGSQGAKTINETLKNIILNKLNKDYQIIWASGPKQYDIIKQELKEQKININKIENVKIIPYIYNMEEVMNVADIIVSRSGAMTITEIAKIGKPAIFIPFPFATENHQEYNAKVLEKVGAARIILDKDLNAQSLSNTIEEMLKDKNKLEQMGQNAKKVSVNYVEDKIYEEIEKVIK